MEAKGSFTSLLKAANGELEKVQQVGSGYFSTGDTAHVREAADRMDKIQVLIQALCQFQSQWQHVIPDPKPIPLSIQVDRQIQRTPPGTKKPQDHYRLPILRALFEMVVKAELVWFKTG